MKNSAKSILKELEGDNRVRVMFYLDENLHRKFKGFCSSKKIRMSDVLEKLIEKFLSEVDGDKKTK